MKRTGVVLGALALSATGWVGSAAAATHATGTTTADDDTQVTSFSAQEQDAALKFWTPERLASAKEMTVGDVPTGGSADTPVTSGADASVAPATGTGAGDVSAAAVTRPKAWKGGGLIRKTAGKVFFQANSGTYTCSATVANSKNGSVVLTAGHCVVDGQSGEVYRNWVFIPAYHQGNRPYGTFTAKKLFHSKRYVTSGANANWDFGFARLSKHNGRTLKQIVGAQGIKFNHPNGQKVHSFGYGGSAAEGSGERLNHCVGKEHKDTGRPGSTMWGIDCVQSGGSSGGGFLAGFKPATGKGFLIGNISVGAGNSEYHPYLGKVARTVYRKAAGA